MLEKHFLNFYPFILVFALAIFALGNWIERTETSLLLLAFGASWIAYLFVLQKKEFEQWLFGVGVLMRLLFFFSMPALSDDVYRFLWDGALWNSGIHPFENAPSYYIAQSEIWVDLALYNQLNSPDYFSVYPPLNQLFFWIGVVLGEGNWLASTNAIRSVLLLADIGAFYTLKKLLELYQKPTHFAFWYFLNPLVIIEFTGNIHFEGLVGFFLLGGVYLFERNKQWIAGASLGLAIGTKLLPLIYLPYLFLKGLKEKKWWIVVIAVVVSLISMLPLLNTRFIHGMQTSLDLYFRSFEFNASTYFLARKVGFWLLGYNGIAFIGPLLAACSFVCIIGISIIGTKKQWPIPPTLLWILAVDIYSFSKHLFLIVY